MPATMQAAARAKQEDGTRHEQGHGQARHWGRCGQTLELSVDLPVDAIDGDRDLPVNRAGELGPRNGVDAVIVPDGGAAGCRRLPVDRNEASSGRGGQISFSISIEVDRRRLPVDLDRAVGRHPQVWLTAVAVDRDLVAGSDGDLDQRVATDDAGGEEAGRIDGHDPRAVIGGPRSDRSSRPGHENDRGQGDDHDEDEAPADARDDQDTDPSMIGRADHGADGRRFRRYKMPAVPTMMAMTTTITMTPIGLFSDWRMIWASRAATGSFGEVAAVTPEFEGVAPVGTTASASTIRGAAFSASASGVSSIQGSSPCSQPWTVGR